MTKFIRLTYSCGVARPMTYPLFGKDWDLETCWEFRQDGTHYDKSSPHSKVTMLRSALPLGVNVGFTSCSVQILASCLDP